MQKILLTGGSGFIGTRLKDVLQSDFHIFSPSSKELNILDKNRIYEIFHRIKPDYVIHGAAIALTKYCDDFPEKCHKINVTGTSNIAEACRDSRSRMIFFSTEQVFNGNRKKGPFSEKQTPLPNTNYGKNKLEAEKRVKELLDNHLILRLTWMFGVPERFRPVVSNILWDTVKMVLSGDSRSVPVNEFRGFTYVNELADQFKNILNLPRGIYHTGSENSLNRYEVVCFILKELGLENRISQFVSKDDKRYRDNIRDVRLDTSLIQSQGIIFSDTEDAIKRCISEYGLNPNWKYPL